MSKLNELIQELCPNGVEYKKLGEVCKINRGVRVTRNVLFSEGTNPVYQNALKPLGFFDKTNREAYTTFVIGAGAAGQIGFSEISFWAADDCYTFDEPQGINNKYIYYFLQTKQHFIDSNVRRSSIPRISRDILTKIEIPLPPIEVQTEIVKILDRFADYSAELQAELQARKEQYEYYRNLLLTFNTTCGGADGKQKMMDKAHREVKWMTLGEVGTFTRGNGLQKKDFTESGVPCIHYGQIYTYYGTSTDKTKSFCSPELAAKITKVKKGNLIIACTSENIEDVCKAVVWLGNEDIVTGGHACVYEHSLNPKYVSYYFQTEAFFTQKKKYARGTKVIDIKASDLAKIIIPIPSLAEQERIVSILDRFETLVSDLSQGLPAEIAAVQEQYEYYRNKLLSFPKYKLNA